VVTADFSQVVDGLFEQYRARRAKATGLQQKIREISASATAPRQVVRVTVTARGEVRAVEFPVGAYRRMPAPELAEVLMSTLAEARDKARAELADLVSAEVSPEFARLVRGDADAGQLLPAEPMMPAVVREYLRSGRPDSQLAAVALPDLGSSLGGESGER